MNRSAYSFLIAAALLAAPAAMSGVDANQTAFVTPLDGSLDVPELVPHDPPADPLDLTVTALGSPAASWRLIAQGAAHLPAPAAALTLSVVKGTAAPATDAAAPWHRHLALAAHDAFTERFDVAAVAAGTVLALEFVYEAAPAYGLQRGYFVHVTDDQAGGLAVSFTPMTYSRIGNDEGTVVTDAEVGWTDEEAPATIVDAVLSPATPPGSGALDGSTTVTGTLQFTGPDNLAYTCRYCTVEIWDDDRGSPHDLLATVETNVNGYFSAYIANNVDNDAGGAGTMDVYLKFKTDSAKGRVLKSDGVLVVYLTGVLQWNCPDGTCALGTRTFTYADDEKKRQFVYRSMVYAWHQYKNGGPNYDAGKVTTRTPVDGWSGHTSGTAHYHPGGEIHIGSGSWGADTIYHEWGHYLMYKGYNNFFPTSNCPSPHYIEKVSHVNCAWTEGWANYIALDVPYNSVYTWTSGSWINLESRTCSWSCTFDSGDTVEGNVAATLWDLRDSVNDGFDSGIYYTRANLWTVFRHDSSVETTFSLYYNDWGPAGFSTTNFKNAAKQNTINY